MHSIFNILKGMTNYNVINSPNMYNLLINTFELISDQDKPKFVQIIKINAGLKVFEDFKNYSYRKPPTPHVMRLTQETKITPTSILDDENETNWIEIDLNE